ncbi:hypothetical protein ACVFYP_08325 [Roseomonas sp. F4]
MSEKPLSAPRPLPEAELSAVTGGYGWLSNPLQDIRDRLAREHPEATSPGSVADQMAAYLQQQRDAALGDAMGEG